MVQGKSLIKNTKQGETQVENERVREKSLSASRTKVLQESRGAIRARRADQEISLSRKPGGAGEAWGERAGASPPPPGPRLAR